MYAHRVEHTQAFTVASYMDHDSKIHWHQVSSTVYRDSKTENKPSKPQEVTDQCLSMVERREKFHPS